MRIAYFANLHVPSKNASGVQITQTCQALVEVGNEVDVHLLSTATTGKELYLYYGVRESFSLILSKGVRYVERATLLPQQIRYVFQVAAAWYASRPGRYDIVYTREPLLGLFTTSHVLEVHMLPDGKSPFFFTLLRRAKKIVVISDGVKEVLLQKGIVTDTVLVAPSGVNLDLYDDSMSKSDARNALGLSQEEGIAIYTGSISSSIGRGPHTLIQLSSFFKGQIKIYIVGQVGDSDKKLICAQAPDMVLVGSVPHEQIAIWQKAADVLLLINPSNSSLFERYTSPMKLFEYMAALRPLVATSQSTVRPFISSANAYPVPPENVAEIAKAVMTVYRNPGEASMRAQRARKDVEAFTWRKRAEHITTYLCEYIHQ